MGQRSPGSCARSSEWATLEREGRLRSHDAVDVQVRRKDPSGKNGRYFLDTFGSTLDHELVEQERPDVVVSVMNERFLMTTPDDAGAPTTHDVAQQKMTEGVLREEITLWREAAEGS